VTAAELISRGSLTLTASGSMIARQGRSCGSRSPPRADGMTRRHAVAWLPPLPPRADRTGVDIHCPEAGAWAVSVVPNTH
jgi:hypothetical protein